MAYAHRLIQDEKIKNNRVHWGLLQTLTTKTTAPKPAPAAQRDYPSLSKTPLP